MLVDIKKIKKDALYKPLLRKFRNFLRKHMESYGLLKSYHYWSTRSMKAKVWEYMGKLELPPKFMTQKCLSMMVLLLFPTIRKKQEGKRLYCEELEIFFKEIQVSCYEIFKENNIKKRAIFFREPLIKLLWHKFITMRPDITISHFRRIRSHPIDGQYRY